MANKTAGVLLPQDAEKVRVALRIYFTALLLLVAYLGSRICALRPRLALRQHGRVPVMHLTGWLSAFDAARTMWLSRSNPLGIMGVLMLVTGSLLTITDLAVSGLVVTQAVQARCLFDTAGGDFLVYPRSNTSVFAHYPDPNNYIALMVKEATATSKRNSGFRGIYTKVNNRADNFRAEAEDVYGSWHCARVDGGNNTVYPATVDPLALVTDLVARGLAYNLNLTGEAYPGTPVYMATLFPTGNMTYPLFSNMVVMSTNAKEIAMTNQTGSVPPSNIWDVRISVENGAVIGLRDPKSMATYGCSIDAPDAEWALKFTYAIALMNFWRSEIFAQVYQGVPSQVYNEGTRLIDNVEEALEDVLNNMIMTTGMLEKRNKDTIDDMSQGCLVDKTWIPWPVVFLFVAAAILLFGVAWYAGYLSWRVLRSRDKLRQANTEGGSGADGESWIAPGSTDIPYVPVGFLSWMKHAVKPRGGKNSEQQQHLLLPNDAASETVVGIKARSLKHLDFALDEESGGQAIFVPRDPTAMATWAGNKAGKKRATTFDERKHMGQGLGASTTMFLTPTTSAPLPMTTGTLEPRRKLRKANRSVYGGSNRSTRSMAGTSSTAASTLRVGVTVNRGHDDAASRERGTSLAVTTPRKALSSETLVSLSPLESPSIDTQHWSNPGEAVAWAGGLRQELERVGSRDGSTQKLGESR